MATLAKVASTARASYERWFEQFDLRFTREMQQAVRQHLTRDFAKRNRHHIIQFMEGNGVVYALIYPPRSKDGRELVVARGEAYWRYPTPHTTYGPVPKYFKQRLKEVFDPIWDLHSELDTMGVSGTFNFVI